jgi:hypothetical protein
VFGVKAVPAVAAVVVVAAPVVAAVVEAAVVLAEAVVAVEAAVVAAPVLAAGGGVLVSVLPQAVNTRERIAIDAIMTQIVFFIESSLFSQFIKGLPGNVACWWYKYASFVDIGEC